MRLLNAMTHSGQAALRAVLIGCVYVYKALSSMLPGSCRYHPTCSTYALTAISRHGPFKGAWLTLRRLSRCHPLGGWGDDPVPPVRASARRDRPARASGVNLKETN